MSRAKKCIPVDDIIGNVTVREMCGGVTRHTLLEWRKNQGFPKPIKKLAGARGDELWDAREVREWLDLRRVPDHHE